ncbi:MAG: BatA and WFA domain-containing protein [Verrucomicrobia bacterium]|nr:BatA and WFA domain-containing protein [Verrucomicrobiota bacterium]
MHFLAPWAFFFAAVLPVVVLFYLLKRRRVVRLISSTVLWQKFIADTQASAPFQKLRHNWLLILQLLLLLLAILALSRPYFFGRTSGGKLQVVILDASASMQSTDVAPSRFEYARGEALKLVDAMHDDDQMVLLQAGSNTEVKQSATSGKSALRRAIQGSAAVDTPTRLQEALKLAETLIQNNPTAEIHLFSDGAIPSLDEFENSGLPLVYHQVGVRSENLGITSLDVRPNPENPAQRAIFASVSNYSTNAHEAQLELRQDGELIEVKVLKMRPRESSPQVFIASQDTDAVLSVHLTGQDDLSVDNQASVVSVLPRPIKVLLLSQGNQLLSKALRVAPNVTLSEASIVPETDEKFDLVVLDNMTPLNMPSGNLLAIHVVQPNWFESVGTLESPPIVDWKSSHPLLRFVNFDNVQIAECLLVKTPTWAASIVDSPQTGLILAGELGRQRIVWIGFDPLQSTWPLRISFPIFIANAIDWLNPASINASQLSIQAGTPFRLALTEQVTEASIRMPGGAVRKLEVNSDKGEIVFGDTAKNGTYHLFGGTNEVIFCVNLLDERESDTTPKPEIKFGEYAKADSTTLRRANLEFWRWFAAACLAVLMLEWWYYHRRTV